MPEMHTDTALPGHLPGRRALLQKLGLGSVLVALAGLGFQWARALVPNLLPEAPARFKIGLPSSIADGVTFLEDRRLYIFKEGKTFHAISAACTHLGCTVRYAALNQPKTVEIGGEKVLVRHEFQCPCHGSRFYADGTNYAGPAPRPLRWHRLAVSPDDGQLLVDLGEEVEQHYRLTV